VDWCTFTQFPLLCTRCTWYTDSSTHISGQRTNYHIAPYWVLVTHRVSGECNAIGRVCLPARHYASAGTSLGPVSVSVCQSVTSRCSIETAERIWLVFLAWKLPSTYPTLCCKEIQVPSTIIVLRTGTFAPNSRLRKVRHGISTVEACYQLTARKVDAQSVMINWAVVGQLRRSTAAVYLVKLCLLHDTVARVS